MVDDSNRKTYSSRGVVHHYAQLNILQPAEKTVLDLLQDQLPNMKMLDIGVGGGRTAKHFSNVAAEYIGIDYSADMVAACKSRFSSASHPAMFEVCDARNMSQFEDNTFDFILFSFNGIDYVSHSDRLKVLKEVARVGKPGAYFCFSSHSLQGIERAFNVKTQLSFNPIKTYVNLVMWVLFRGFNASIIPHKLQAANYAVIRDESHNFRLKTYYIRPKEQVNQLTPDFTDIKTYSWKSGLEITQEKELCANVDQWLYYLCVIK
ncbi:MAG: class I SAM-dependent methyltransferase [Cyanobacteria bacterium Co-bin8]|nr:class I SAM-dependent methyltransferase [Cyanobacteria bacterium Co-bin8]